MGKNDMLSDIREIVRTVERKIDALSFEEQGNLFAAFIAVATILLILRKTMS